MTLNEEAGVVNMAHSATKMLAFEVSRILNFGYDSHASSVLLIAGAIIRTRTCFQTVPISLIMFGPHILYRCLVIHPDPVEADWKLLTAKS